MATGVKRFVTLPNVRTEFDRRFPKHGVVTKNDIKAEPRASNPSLIGNAFDFLCGLWVQHNISEFIPGPNSHPVFSQNQMRVPYRRDGLTKEYLDAMEVCVDYVETGVVDTDLFEAVLLLVQYENYCIESSRHFHYKRNHYEPDDASNLENPPDPARVGQFDKAEIKDLSNIFGLLDGHGLFQASTAYFKPLFGNRIDLLKAEGDVLLDGTLIDIKVTVDGKWKNQYWRQLIAYYLLNDINNSLHDIDYRTCDRRTYPEIDELGIYFARHGELRTRPINEIFPESNKYYRFRAWFTNEIIEHDRDHRFDYSEVKQELCEPWAYEQQASIGDFC